MVTCGIEVTEFKFEVRSDLRGYFKVTMASKVIQVAVIGIGCPPLPHPMFLGDQLVTFHGIQCPLIYRAIALLFWKTTRPPRNLHRRRHNRICNIWTVTTRHRGTAPELHSAVWTSLR